MRWGWAIICVGLCGCAPDVSNYTPVMDQDLVAQHPEATAAHLVQCRRNVAKLPRPPIIGTVVGQIATTAGNPLMTAAELGTPAAAEAAGGAIVVGAATGTKTWFTSEQATAQARVDRCMRNHGEPTEDE